MGPPSTKTKIKFVIWRQHSRYFLVRVGIWVKGVSSPLRQKEKRERLLGDHKGDGEMRRTIHCELKGNPVTAAGPNERAVFMPAPV
jgi:hypothetical protein